MVNYQKEIEDLIQVQRWEQAMGTESQEMLDYAIPDEYSESSLQRWGSDTWPREGEEEDVFAIRSAKNIITGERWILYQIYKLRLDFETAFLYYNYHYNPGVKMEGSKTIEVKVSDRMIQVVGQVQKHMQRKIAALGVGVEANPSSNYLIGTFRRYDKHPLLRFYNIGLTSDEKELQECPQISTSINTDDQGVFATSLENEYALMVLALERIKGEDGKAKYSRERIYKWLDDIREMGIRQSFLRRNR